MHAILKMMVDAFGGGNASQTASAVDDFYSSDAPQQQPVFCAGGPTTGSNVSTETAVQQTDADQLSPSPQAAQTRATVCLGGSPPSPSELSGTLDSHKVPGGAKFAVSQVLIASIYGQLTDSLSSLLNKGLRSLLLQLYAGHVVLFLFLLHCMHESICKLVVGV